MNGSFEDDGTGTGCCGLAVHGKNQLFSQLASPRSFTQLSGLIYAGAITAGCNFIIISMNRLRLVL